MDSQLLAASSEGDADADAIVVVVVVRCDAAVVDALRRGAAGRGLDVALGLRCCFGRFGRGGGRGGGGCLRGLGRGLAFLFVDHVALEVFLDVERGVGLLFFGREGGLGGWDDEEKVRKASSDVVDNEAKTKRQREQRVLLFLARALPPPLSPGFLSLSLSRLFSPSRADAWGVTVKEKRVYKGKKKENEFFLLA